MSRTRCPTRLVSFFASCPVMLSAPDTVLIERTLGKRVDPQTGGRHPRPHCTTPPLHPQRRAQRPCPPVLAEIYHTTFDWPPASEVQNRLVVPEGISELETAQKLLEHHRSIVRILPSYPKILKVISADQPCVDVFYQGELGWGAGSPAP